MKTRSSLDDLPGGALVQRGISDLRTNRHTVASCLVRIAHGRLSQAGLLPPKGRNDLSQPPAVEPELQLYRLLRAEGGDAYSRYNALLRELVSFEQAFERMEKRGATSPGHVFDILERPAFPPRPRPTAPDADARGELPNAV